MAVSVVSATPGTVTLFDPRRMLTTPLLEKVVIPLNSLGPSARRAVLPGVTACAQTPTPRSSPRTIVDEPRRPTKPAPVTPVSVPSPITPQRPLPRTPAARPVPLVPHTSFVAALLPAPEAA